MNEQTGIERLREAFERRGADNQKVLVPYLTAGDPDLKTTAALLDSVADAGADIIELGIPFSDPMADGPVLQQAAERALMNPITLDEILDCAAEFNQRSSVPIILFGYYNPFFIYGHARLAARARAAGVCGILCVDLPPEEAEPLRDALAAEGLALVPLLTPTSDDARIHRARSVATAFGYYVSITGVTGASLVGRQPTADRIREVREVFDLPMVVGFGVKNASDAKRLSEEADGVVVGSALVKLAFESEEANRSDAVYDFIASLRAAV